MTDDDINPADIPGIFLYGCQKLRVGDRGLIPAVHDPDDLDTVGTLAVLINRLTEQGDTPFDAIVSNLAVLAAALIVADTAGLPMPHIAGRWRKLLGTALELQQLATRR